MIHKITPKQWDAMLAVHCTAPFRLIQAWRSPSHAEPNPHMGCQLCHSLLLLPNP